MWLNQILTERQGRGFREGSAAGMVLASVLISPAAGNAAKLTREDIMDKLLILKVLIYAPRIGICRNLSSKMNRTNGNLFFAGFHFSIWWMHQCFCMARLLVRSIDWLIDWLIDFGMSHAHGGGSSHCALRTQPLYCYEYCTSWACWKKNAFVDVFHFSRMFFSHSCCSVLF